MFAFYDNWSAAALIITMAFSVIAAVLFAPRGPGPTPVTAWAATVAWLGVGFFALGVLLAFEP